MGVNRPSVQRAPLPRAGRRGVSGAVRGVTLATVDAGRTDAGGIGTVSRGPVTRRAVAALLSAAALVGCVSTDESQRQAEVPDDGLQATGLLDGRRVAISRGEPGVIDGDCDANDGTDRDLCLRVRTIDGVTLNLVLENPGALAVGERLEVRRDPCEHCDDVVSYAVVRVRVGGESREAQRGHLTPTRVDDRIAADFDLHLSDGDRLTGSFSVRPSLAGP